MLPEEDPEKENTYHCYGESDTQNKGIFDKLVNIFSFE